MVKTRPTKLRSLNVSLPTLVVPKDVVTKIVAREKFLHFEMRELDAQMRRCNLFSVRRSHVGTYTIYLGHADWPIMTYMDFEERWYVNHFSATASNIVGRGQFRAADIRQHDLIRLAEHGRAIEVMEMMEKALG